MNTVKYWALLVLNKCDDDAIVKECCSAEKIKELTNKPPKKLSHVSLCVNDFKAENEPTVLTNIGNVIQWLILSDVQMISIFDQEGLFKNNTQRLSKHLEQRISGHKIENNTKQNQITITSKKDEKMRVTLSFMSK